jgi:hypothetical protein
MARRVLGLINSRWKPVDKLVADYNLEVERYNRRVDPEGPVRLRPLSHRQLREIGIDDADGEVWDVERLLCNEDWGVHDYVRHGIDARYRQKRAAEENKYLSLHVDRIVRWLSQQTAVLQELALDIPASKSIRVCPPWPSFLRSVLHEDRTAKVRDHSLDVRPDLGHELLSEASLRMYQWRTLSGIVSSCPLSLPSAPRVLYTVKAIVSVQEAISFHVPAIYPQVFDCPTKSQELEGSQGIRDPW